MKNPVQRILLFTAVLMCATPSPAPGATLELTSPVGGEVWMVGTLHDITWKARGIEGQVLIEVLWRKKDGSSKVFASADGIPASRGKWTWKIPFEFPIANTVFARITLHDPEGAAGKMRDSGNYFSIVDNPAPFLQLRSPVGGESWAVGSPHRISWETRNLEGKLDISLEKAGSPVTYLGSIPVSDGHMTWTPPPGTPVGSGYKIRVRAPSAGLSSPSDSFRLIARPPIPKEWTFLAYIGADNNLEEYELDDFLEMARVGSNRDVDVVVEVDRHPAYDARFGNWTGTRRYHVTRGMKPAPKSAVQNLGEINTGNEERLADFLCWAMDHYPAKRYILLFSDHGYGWEPDGGERNDGGKIVAPQAVIRDDTNGLLWISTRGLEAALRAAPSPIAVVGFDSCDMDMIEVAYQLRHTGSKVFIASQNEEGTYGWDHGKLLTALQEHPGSISDREVGIRVVDDFMIRNAQLAPKWPATQAALDLAAMDSLGESVKALVRAMLAVPGDKARVRSAADHVLAAMDQAIIREQHSPYMNGYVFGTNIYFPAEKMDSRYTPETLDFAGATRWAEFLNAYLERGMASTWIGKARQHLYEEENDGHIDLVAFCRGLSPAPEDIRVHVSAASDRLGSTIPEGSSILYDGALLKIRAVPKGKTARFVRWDVKGDVELTNSYSANTSLTARGNGSVTAVFSAD